MLGHDFVVVTKRRMHDFRGFVVSDWTAARQGKSGAAAIAAGFNLEMPGVYYYQYDDEQMAAILSYIRQAWGNNASPISAELVAKIRATTGERDSWTVEELAEIE